MALPKLSIDPKELGSNALKYAQRGFEDTLGSVTDGASSLEDAGVHGISAIWKSIMGTLTSGWSHLISAVSSACGWAAPAVSPAPVVEPAPAAAPVPASPAPTSGLPASVTKPAEAKGPAKPGTGR